MFDLVSAPPDAVARLQGRAQSSQEVLACMDEAAGFLDKMSRKQQQIGEDGNARSTRISSQASGAF